MQKQFIYIDTVTKAQMDASGRFVTRPSDFVTIERGQWQILCIQFSRRTVDEFGTITLEPVSLAGNSYLFVADNDFSDDNSLMLKSLQSLTPFDENASASNRFNIEGDWIDGGTADMSEGQMSIRINSNTEKFKTAVGDRKSVTSNLYINIKQYIAGISNPSSIAWIPFTALNTIRDWEDPEEIPPEGTTIIPFINSYLQKPIEFQFSIDGTTEWHTVQTAEDNYYRQRISGIDSDWSPAIMLARGADGAEGEDGVDGYTPVKGTDYWTEADKQEIKDYVDSAILNGEW